jgi:DNA-directed RNA polymerase specialized sigma24 family protein
VRYDKERVQTSGDADQNRDSDRLIDLERDISRKVEKAVALRESMIAEIEQVQSPQYVALLLHRYVDGMRFEEIACEMGYSYARVTHLHGEALQAFGRLREAQD